MDIHTHTDMFMFNIAKRHCAQQKCVSKGSVKFSANKTLPEGEMCVNNMYTKLCITGKTATRINYRLFDYFYGKYKLVNFTKYIILYIDMIMFCSMNYLYIVPCTGLNAEKLT